MSAAREVARKILGFPRSETAPVRRKLDAAEAVIEQHAEQARAEERERFARASDTAAKLAPEVPPEVIDAWLGRELADFRMVMNHCSEVYCHFTRDRISKPQTLPREVITVAEDLENEELEERRVAVRAIVAKIGGDTEELLADIEDALS